MFKLKHWKERTILFVFLIMIMYLICQNVENEILSIVDHNQSRGNFLENSFCGKFVNGDWESTMNQSQIDDYNRFLRMKIKSLEMLHQNFSCNEFIKVNGFYEKSLRDEEYKTPQAFSILVYKNLYQFQVLIRTLYTRTNYHCIHLDEKASIHFYNYVLKLSTCLENIFIVKQRINIRWGTMSTLQAERLCQKILLNQSSKWHYHITIAGSELPIQTNLNRIQILSLTPSKSRNDVSSLPQLKNRQSSKRNSSNWNLTIYKGEFHSILTRDFIHQVHHNSLSNDLWLYLSGTSVPDEHFYPTLVHLSELPGGKERGTLMYPYYELLSHYKSWGHQPYHQCQSKHFVEGVCQFNSKDLFNIEQSGRLFANKFNQDLDLISIYCWEQWINIKQLHHLDIQSEDYINKYPFTRRNQTENIEAIEEHLKMIKYFSQE